MKNKSFCQLYYCLTKSIESIFKRKRLAPERQGILPGPVDLWMHASSVGEATVAVAILKEFLNFFSDIQVLLTLFTPTGVKKAKELLRDNRVNITLAPYDLPLFVKQAIKQTRPKVFALIETELWPNLILFLWRAGAKILLLNGRISKKSFPRYRLMKPLFQEILSLFEGLGVIGDTESKRFKALGVPEEKIKIFGNAKHDLLKARAEAFDSSPIKMRLGLEQEEVIVFGSIRGGEEKHIAKTIYHLWSLKGLIFIVVPRHLELVSSLKTAFKRFGLAFEMWSKLDGKSKNKIILVDEIGPLFGLYSIAKIAFVGGSLVPKGGQNPMEPAAFGVPVVFGPYMENFETEAKALLREGGGFFAKNSDELIFLIEELLYNHKLYLLASNSAKQTISKLCGSAKAQAKWLSSFF